MILLGDVGQVEPCFGPHGDSVNLGGKIGARFVMNIPQTQKSFWTHPILVLGDVCQVEGRLSPFGYSVIPITQRRCTLRAECTMGMEVIFCTAYCTPR
jgi:hypothetical protein